MSTETTNDVTEYYMLECYSPGGVDYLDVESYPEIPGIASWLQGAPIEVPVPQPIRLQWDAETSGLPKKMYDLNIPLMHRDLVASLREAGVNNLQTFAVLIAHPATRETSAEYRAVNVIGLLMAADLNNSIYRDPSGRGRIDMDFDSLAIDANRTWGAKLFRLGECVSGLVIHRGVVEHLRQAGGFGLQFIEPREWIG